MKVGKFLLYVVLGTLAVVMTFKLVTGLFLWAVSGILGLIVPLALVAAVVFVIFKLTEKKVLGANKRDSLP